jgi:carbamoylphosphate synthase large subunit
VQIPAINQRARQRYASFVTAMDMVREALDNLTPLLVKVRKPSGGSGWTVPTREELAGLKRTATEELERLRAKSKKYEAELVSREWRL